MNTPDKIHLFFSSDDDYLIFKKKPFEGTVAYIREDALLEWVKEKLETLKLLLDTDPYSEAYIGKCEAFKEVIDKLNSM